MMSTQSPPTLPRIFRSSLILLWLLQASPVGAHRVSSVSLISYLDTKKETYVLDAAMEVIPSEEQAVNDQISPEDAARQFAEEYLVVLFDRKDQKPEMEIRIEDASDTDTPPELRRQQVLTKMSGKIPEGAAEFLLYLDPGCPMAVVMVVIKDDQPSRRMQVVLAGEYSRPINVAPVEEGDPFLSESAVSPMPPESENAGSNAGAEAEVVSKVKPGAFRAGWRAFLRDGFLPGLFVVALLLLTLEKRSVFLQVGAGLAGLSVAISLAALRQYSVPDWSNLAFKLLFAVIAMEALFHDRLRWWRLPLVAAGGVFAGLEIAGTPSFRDVFMERGSDAGGLFGFFMGAELAFFLVAFAAALLLLLLNRFGWYRRAVVHPLAVLLVSYGLFGVVELFL